MGDVSEYVVSLERRYCLHYRMKHTEHVGYILEVIELLLLLFLIFCFSITSVLFFPSHEKNTFNTTIAIDLMTITQK